jgi:hypothetical protein
MSTILTVLILKLLIMAGYTEAFNSQLLYFVYGFQTVGEASGFHSFLPNVTLESPMTIRFQKTVNRGELSIFYPARNDSYSINAKIDDIYPRKSDNRSICSENSSLQNMRIVLGGLTKDIVLLTCAIDSVTKLEAGHYSMFLSVIFSKNYQKFNEPINFLVNGSRINECYCRHNQSKKQNLVVSNDSILGRILTVLFVISIIITCMLLFNMNLRE